MCACEIDACVRGVVRVCGVCQRRNLFLLTLLSALARRISSYSSLIAATPMIKMNPAAVVQGDMGDTTGMKDRMTTIKKYILVSRQNCKD